MIGSVCPAALFKADSHRLEESHVQHRRSAPQLKALPLSEENPDSRANLSELLARLISTRKGVCFGVDTKEGLRGVRARLLGKKCPSNFQKQGPLPSSLLPCGGRLITGIGAQARFVK